MNSESNKLAVHVSFVGIIVNIVLSLIKIFAGIFSHSAAMISDAIHSASDVVSTIIVIVGVKASNKHSDKEHPYGHDRMECVASLILAIALCITGILIGKSAVIDIVTKEYLKKSIPGMMALFAAVLSIATKEWMYQYTIRAAKKINSTALMADAWHHRSDAISSIGALIGIGLAILGFPIADPIASILICILIVKVSIDIFKESIERMIDTSADAKTEQKIRDVIMSVDGVLEINVLTTRLFGSRMYVDVEFSADGNLSLIQSHDIAEKVHNTLEKDFPEIKHCMVHVNPKTN